ncbi:hypothetical protein [Aquimarina aggregata]|uniref:hypothetical protein n=1 Tax=Aquimarina aggregata TaxID=1642818 RepID=UPI002492CFCB|nr:hypothetical protein [Aquimarina aggregata]
MKRLPKTIYLLLIIGISYFTACTNNKAKPTEATTAISETQENSTQQEDTINALSNTQKNIENPLPENDEDVVPSQPWTISDTLKLGEYTVYITPTTQEVFKNGSHTTQLMEVEDKKAPSLTDFLAEHPTIHIKGDTLKIKMEQKEVVLVNRDTPTEFQNYRINTSNAISGYYSVDVTEMESHHHLFIHIKTGTITRSYGIPVPVKPDFFIAPNWDVEAGFTFNGFEFFVQNKEGILEHVSSKDPYSWGPEAYSLNEKNEMLVQTGIAKNPFIKIVVEKIDE